MKRFVYTLLYFICFVQCTLITTTDTNYSDACEESLETYALSVRDAFYPEPPTKTSDEPFTGDGDVITHPITMFDN